MDATKMEAVDIRVAHMLRKHLLPYPLDEIAETFGAIPFRRSIFCFDDGHRFIKKYIEISKPKTVLDIGTLTGIGAAYMATLCNHVYTIDIVDEPLRQPIMSFLKPELQQKITFILVENEIEKEKIISDLQFDFCLSDGDHRNYTYSDWMMVRKCERVMFHEYFHARESRQSAVSHLVNSLPQNEVIKETRAPFAFWYKHLKK